MNPAAEFNLELSERLCNTLEALLQRGYDPSLVELLRSAGIEAESSVFPSYFSQLLATRLFISCEQHGMPFVTEDDPWLLSHPELYLSCFADVVATYCQDQLPGTPSSQFLDQLPPSLRDTAAALFVKTMLDVEHQPSAVQARFTNLTDGDIEHGVRLFRASLLACGSESLSAGPDWDPSELIGKEVDGLRVGQLLGVGGFSHVFKAEQCSTGKWVALKCLRNVEQLNQAADAFAREIEAMRDLRHPSVANLIDFRILQIPGRTGMIPCLISDYADGIHIDEYVRGHVLPDASFCQEVLRLLLELCDAVVAVHFRKLIHADIKPSNVLVDEHGRVVLLDLGIARQMRQRTASQTPTKFCGTPQYMSPEQLSGAEPDYQSDVYALGLVMFELLCNRRPYDVPGWSSADPRAALQQIRDVVCAANPPRIETILGGAPVVLGDVIARALSTDPTQRQRDAIELRDDLKRCLQQVQQRASQLSLLRVPSFDKERQQHLPDFVERKWLAKLVAEWFESDTGPRIGALLGGPGVGKSAFCAWLSDSQPNRMLVHLCAFGHDLKGTAAGCVRSLVAQLKAANSVFRDELHQRNLDVISSDATATALLDELLLQPLAAVASKNIDGRYCLVIDGLDELPQPEAAALLSALSAALHQLPSWLKVLVSSRPHPELLSLCSSFQQFPVDPSDNSNKKDLWNFTARSLAPFFEDQDLAKGATAVVVAASEGLFLYVKWVVEDLRSGQLKAHEILNLPRGLAGAIGRIMQRQFPVPEKYTPRLREVLELIVAAIQPLTFDELGSASGLSFYELRDQIAACGALFQVINGRVIPFHSAFLDWLDDEKEAGRYFVSKSQGAARLTDYCWRSYQERGSEIRGYPLRALHRHLTINEDWDRLAALLADVDYLSNWNPDIPTIEVLWHNLESHSQHRRLAAYASVVESPENFGSGAYLVSILLRNLGYTDDAIRLGEYLARQVRAEPASRRKLDILYTYAVGLCDQSRNVEALEEMKVVLAIAVELGYLPTVGECHSTIGTLLLDQGKLDAAEQHFVLVRDLFVQYLPGVSFCYRNFGLLAWERRDFQLAERYFELTVEAAQAVSDFLSVIHALIYHAKLLLSIKKEFGRAAAFLEQAELYCNRQGFRRLLDLVSLARGGVAAEEGRLEEALKIYEDLCRESHSLTIVTQSTSGAASVLCQLGRHTEAVNLLREYLASGGISTPARAEINSVLAPLESRLGNRDSAFTCYEAALSAYRAEQAASDFAKTAIQYSVCLIDDEKFQRVREVIVEAVEWCRSVKNDRLLVLATSPRVIAELELGREAEAIQLLQSAVNVCEANEWEDELILLISSVGGPTWNSQNQLNLVALWSTVESALLRSGKTLTPECQGSLLSHCRNIYTSQRVNGILDGAVDALQLATRILRRHPISTALCGCLVSLAQAYVELGQTEDAMKVACECEDAAMQIQDRNSIAPALETQVGCAIALKRDVEEVKGICARLQRVTTDDLDEAKICYMSANARLANYCGDSATAFTEFRNLLLAGRERGDRPMWVGSLLNLFMVIPRTPDQQDLLHRDFEQLKNAMASDPLLEKEMKLRLAWLQNQNAAEPGPRPIKDREQRTTESRAHSVTRTANRGQKLPQQLKAEQKVGANAVCPKCKSGKKFKDCCRPKLNGS